MTQSDLVTVGIAWLLLAGLVAWVATLKGKSGATWFVTALVLSPLIAGLIVFMTDPEPRVVQPQPTTSITPSQPAMPPAPAISIADELAKLIALRESGELSAAEFARARVNLMAGTSPPAPGPPASTWQSGRLRPHFRRPRLRLSFSQPPRDAPLRRRLSSG